MRRTHVMVLGTSPSFPQIFPRLVGPDRRAVPLSFVRKINFESLHCDVTHMPCGGGGERACLKREILFHFFGAAAWQA